MSQPIAPELWQEGIDDFTLLPAANLAQYFTGQGIKFANVGSSYASATVRVWDFQISDAIFTPDSRRLNGLGGPSANTEGRDGWGASYYGVAQDIRFDWRYYKMGRERSNLMRLWKVETYDGEIGDFGTDSSVPIVTNGENLMPVARQISLATKRWQDLVLDADIKGYTMSAILQGHISGRWLDATPDSVFNGEGQWIAQPGVTQGEVIPPRFAPIHCIEWSNTNIPLMLQNIKVTWNNMRIPESDRCLVIDPYYEYQFIASMTGMGVPVTEAGVDYLKNGQCRHLMGWDIYFDIPTQYWPRLYVDANLNVVHSPTGTASYDQAINSIANDGTDTGLLKQLVASDRMQRTNFVRTVWTPGRGYEHVVTNYPQGDPATVPYLGVPETVAYSNYGTGSYPWAGPGAGYGLDNPTGPVQPITRAQVIGMFIYKKAAQIGQQYSEMITDEGKIRGPFTEWAFAIKYDAWVNELWSHGIVPIVDINANIGIPAIKTEVVTPNNDPVAVTGITVTPATMALTVGQNKQATVTIAGTGEFDNRWTATSSAPARATVSATGVITGVSAGTATITFKSVGDATKTATVAVTVS